MSPPLASGSHTDPYCDYPNSDWSTASNALKRPRQPPSRLSTRQEQAHKLIQHSTSSPKTYSRLRQQVLPEEEYLTGLEDVILRDFFPQLATLTAQQAVQDAVENEDQGQIESSMRRMRELCTPTPKRRATGEPPQWRQRLNSELTRPSLAASTPGRTPFDNSPSSTPISSTSRQPASRYPSHPAATAYDPSLSLDAFQARYTSEDNSSFSDLLARDNLARREKYGWAFQAEERANVKAIRGREARERLVDVTRRMVEGSRDGTVAMIDGPAGRPGERRMVVEGIKLGEDGGRLMVEGSRGTGGQLLITGEAAVAEGEKAMVRVEGSGTDKGKGKQEQYVDWDRTTAEEDEESKQLTVDEVQVRVDLWPFTVSCSFRHLSLVP